MYLLTIVSNQSRATKEYSDCQILVTEGQYFNRPYAWPFPKHSPFLQIFNFYIGEMFEKGQWNAIQKKYEPMDQVCPDMSGSPIEISGKVIQPKYSKHWHYHLAATMDCGCSRILNHG